MKTYLLTFKWNDEDHIIMKVRYEVATLTFDVVKDRPEVEYAFITEIDELGARVILDYVKEN